MSFAAVGRFAYRRRKTIALVWALLFLASAPLLTKVEEPLKVGGFSSNKTEAARARAILADQLHADPSSMIVIYQSTGAMTTDDPRFFAEIRQSLSRIATVPHVTDVVYPSEDPSLISRDKRTAYAIVGLDLPSEQAQRSTDAFRAAVQPAPDLSLLIAGAPAFYADIETVSQRDLRRAELIAFPFALIALLLVFGTVVAAAIPLAVGGFGVAAVLVAIFAIAQLTDLSIFVLNLATMLGLGLAVDYSLFITSRFREELARNGGDVPRAVERSIATAGRAIFFSGLTVLIGLSGLIWFDFMFLRSVGVAGVVVVFFSVLAALTLLPALLGIIGPRIERLKVIRRRPDHVDAHHDHGFWARLSYAVMRRPVAVLVPTLLLLVLLGAPFLNVSISSPDATILPKDAPSRHGLDVLSSEYGPGEISPFVIAFETTTSTFSSENVGALYDFTEWLKAQPGIVRVQGIATFDQPVSREQAIAYVGLRRVAAQAGIQPRFNDFAADHAAVLLAYSDSTANSDANKALLKVIRAHAPGGDFTKEVDGGTAEIVDVVSLMYSDFPRAIGLIVIATYLVLLILFRALFLPLKAILMNSLSILASYGALVWIFQEGHLHGLLRFAPLGFVEASLPIIMFCVLFGLSMDYEVFLLSRVREEWDRTHDNTRSVAVGLQRSGRIITSAALIVVVVTASFVSADVVIVKALGLGIALAVFLDATIVRGLLAPATMRLLGHWNWWLPRPLERWLPGARLHDET